SVIQSTHVFDSCDRDAPPQPAQRLSRPLCRTALGQRPAALDRSAESRWWRVGRNRLWTIVRIGFGGSVEGGIPALPSCKGRTKSWRAARVFRWPELLRLGGLIGRPSRRGLAVRTGREEGRR